MRHPLQIVCAVIALATVAQAADPLDSVCTRIDAASRTFKGMTADISNTQHTAVVNDDSTQTGVITLLRVKPGQTKMLVNLKDPGAQIVAIDEKEAKVFNPRTNIVAVWDLGKYKDLANQFLLLGFGASSAELKSNYDLTYVGEEKIGSRQTTRVKLVPKSLETRRKMKQAELWFTDDGLVAQQKFLWAAGDYKLVTYTNIQKRSSVPDKELELKPKGATYQKQEQ